MNVGDLATWVGAAGTLLAFFGTIRLSTKETRRKNRENLIRARLHGSGMILRIGEVQRFVGNITTRMHEAGEIDQAPAYFGQCGDLLAGLQLWKLADLEPLIALPNNTAMKLARASDLIQASITMMRSAAATDVASTNTRQEIALAAAEMLKSAEHNLWDAARECSTAFSDQSLEQQ